MSQILLGLLVAAFVSAGAPVILGADETLERRRGAKIKAKGIFRDAVRSSQKYTNYSSGLRWVSMMLLVPVPWSDRVWALPFAIALVRYHLWTTMKFVNSPVESRFRLIPDPILPGLVETICYAR